MTNWETFDQNEIYIFILLAFFYLILFLILRKKTFTPQITWLSLVWGFTIGTLFEFTIGGGLLDFYKMNDTNEYEVTDLLYYFLFAPFGYFFFYFYHVMKIQKVKIIFYIIAWTFVGVAAEWFFTKIGIITLQKGYQLSYSFPVFLVTQSVTALIYELVKSKERIFQSA